MEGRSRRAGRWCTACLTDEYFAAGLLARLLIAQPPTPAKRWTDDELSPGTFGRFEDVIRKLLAQEHDRDDDGELVPKDLSLSADARARWIDFYNEFAVRQADAPGDDLAAAFSKIEAYAARFALLYQCVGSVTGTAAADCVDDEAMEAGIMLARWFADEAERIYSGWMETAEGRDRRTLIEWIQRRGGAVSVRDLTHGLRRFRGHGDGAKNALRELVAAGLGNWLDEVSLKGGAPARRFRLATVTGATVTTTPLGSTENGGSGDGDGGVGSESEVGEWAG